MNALVVFATVMSVAYAQHWGGHGQWAGHNNAPGLPQDTPEVAAAKAAHLAALAKVNQNNGGVWAGQWDNDDGQWHGDQSGNWNNGAANTQWNGAGQWQTYGNGGRWNGPLALPPGFDNNGAPLPVQDTPEVAAEKSKHFALYNGARSAGPYNGAWNANNGAWNGNNGAWNGNNGAWNNNNGAWNGNSGHGRWRRHAVLAAPLAVAHAPVLAHTAIATPIVRTHAIAAPVVAHTAIASPVLTHSAIATPLISTHGYAHGLAHW